jgi:hypothetical protein
MQPIRSVVHFMVHFGSWPLSEVSGPDPATEFDIQGLEQDWVGVCWDADFRSVDGRWQFYRFSGTRWQNINDDNRKVYLTNA